MLNRDLPMIANIIEKACSCEDIEVNIKLQLLSLMRELKIINSLFMQKRQNIINKHAIKLENGAFKTAKRDIGDKEIVSYVFKDEEAYIKEMNPIMNEKIELKSKVHFSDSTLCTLNLTVKEVDILSRFFTIKRRDGIANGN